MPIWLEVIALSLAAYAVGLLIGWGLWSGEFRRKPEDAADQDPAENTEPDERSTT
ncbi:hypothetical protein ACFCW2_09515 [Qipengyuania sp. DSG2-2]|uniref:hypothetical protein n=1 Tax=Qipengyuania sp. DGS2-2 TaxID=3349631 RepID=UPI0036D29D87